MSKERKNWFIIVKLTFADHEIVSWFKDYQTAKEIYEYYKKLSFKGTSFLLCRILEEYKSES